MERYMVRANFNGNLSSKPPISSYRVKDSELSIFDAERYFNEGDKQQNSVKKTIILNQVSDKCDAITNPRDSSVSSIDGYGRNWRNRSFRTTPTSSSEASWNSQSGLLSNPPGSAALNVKAFPLNEKRKPSSASRRFFSRNCPCYGKKSVGVEEKYSEPNTPVRCRTEKASSSVMNVVEAPDIEQPVDDVAKMKISAGLNWPKESYGFTFPVLAPAPPARKSSGADDPARDSLEVFRPQDELQLMNVRRAPQVMAVDDDVASDTSSDLFEIESLSTHSAYRRRDDPLDEFPKLAGNVAAMLQFKRLSLDDLAPSECYAPSEVSVEWSVTTAEAGFDRASVGHFSSAASGYEEARFIQTEPDRTGNKKKGGLLSCRCENSVNVGPDPVRIDRPDQTRTEPDRGLGISRFGMEKIHELGQSNAARLNRAVRIR